MVVRWYFPHNFQGLPSFAWGENVKHIVLNMGLKCSGPHKIWSPTGTHPVLGAGFPTVLAGKIPVLLASHSPFSHAKVCKRTSIIINQVFFPRLISWLVVYLPLWKIWLRQLGWWNSQYMESHKIHVPNQQPVSLNIIGHIHQFTIAIPSKKSSVPSYSQMGMMPMIPITLGREVIMIHPVSCQWIYWWFTDWLVNNGIYYGIIINNAII